MPFLSIIVPIFRAEAHISQCVDSILDQVFTDFELILIDDGSPDTCGAICDAYAAKDARVRVVHKENEGLVRARKSGLDAAAGNYIGFVDADDWIEPKMFQLLCAAAVSTGSEMVGCNFFLEYPDATAYGGGVVPPGSYDKDRLRVEVYPVMLTTFEFGEYGITPAVWCKIFKRNVLSRNLESVPDQLRNGEDGAITYPCLMDIQSLCLLGDTLYHYRQHPDQMTRNFGESHLTSLLLWVNHLRDTATAKGFGSLDDQIDYYVQYKASLMLASLLDEGRNRERGDTGLVRQLSSSPVVRSALGRRQLGQLSWENRAAFRALRHGNWRIAIHVYRLIRFSKRLRNALVGAFTHK